MRVCLSLKNAAVYSQRSYCNLECVRKKQTNGPCRAMLAPPGRSFYIRMALGFFFDDVHDQDLSCCFVLSGLFGFFPGTSCPRSVLIVTEIFFIWLHHIFSRNYLSVCSSVSIFCLLLRLIPSFRFPCLCPLLSV